MCLFPGGSKTSRRPIRSLAFYPIFKSCLTSGIWQPILVYIILGGTPYFLYIWVFGKYYLYVEYLAYLVSTKKLFENMGDEIFCNLSLATVASPSGLEKTFHIPKSNRKWYD